MLSRHQYKHGLNTMFFNSNWGVEVATKPNINISSKSNIKGIKSWIAPYFTILASSCPVVVLSILGTMGMNSTSNSIMGLDVLAFNTLTSTLQALRLWLFEIVHPSQCAANAMFFGLPVA